MLNNKKLTARQENFCLAYVKLGNATQAYKDAGYSSDKDNTCAVNSWKLLRNAKIAARIQELQAEVKNAKMMDIAERREVLANIARDSESTKQDVIKAIDTLNKMDGAYLNRTEITGGVPVVICDDITDDVKRQNA